MFCIIVGILQERFTEELFSALYLFREKKVHHKGTSFRWIRPIPSEISFFMVHTGRKS